MYAITLIIFLVLNFGALAIGGSFTGSGVSSDWYQQLSKAPWTPPGWVFGFAWSLIMICFSIYMANAYTSAANNKTVLLVLFGIQWLLNVAWNIIFFKYQRTAVGLVDISLLLFVVCALLVMALRQGQLWQTILMVPYALWLIIATSLNAWIVIRN